MPKPKYLNQARHLIAEYNEAMITEEQFRYHLRQFNRDVDRTSGNEQLETLRNQSQSILQQAEELSRADQPEYDDIDTLADRLEVLDNGMNALQQPNEQVDRLKTQWNRYDFNAYENVPYNGFGYDLAEMEPEEGPGNEPEDYQSFIDRFAIRTEDDDYALQNLARCMTAVKMRQEGKPFDAQKIYSDAEILKNSKPFQEAFENRIPGMEIMDIGNDLAKEYLETKQFTDAIQFMSKYMDPVEAPEENAGEAGPQVQEEAVEPEVERQSEAPVDVREYFRGGDPDSMISRRGLMQEVRETNWMIRSETEMATYILGADTAHRNLMEEIPYGQALDVVQQIHGQTKRLQGSIDKVEDIQARMHQFPEAGQNGAEEKPGTLDVYMLRMIDHLDLPAGVDKKRKKQELIDRIKSRGVDYREYYELSCSIPEDGKPLKEQDSYVYEYVPSDKDFALMTAFVNCTEGKAREKVPSAAAFKAEVGRMKTRPLIKVVMGNKRTVEMLRRGDADGVAAALKQAKKDLTFQNKNDSETAKENAQKVLNAMERMQGRDTQSPEWLALKESVRAYADHPDGKTAEYAANVLVNVEKFTKGKKNFQRDPNRQECVDLALDALKTCVPNAQTNPVSKPLVDRFTQVRGRNRALDMSKYGVGSVREEKLYPTYQDLWNDLEKRAVVEDEQIRKFDMAIAMNNLDDPGVVRLRFRGKQALLKGMFPGAASNPEWRMTPEIREHYNKAARLAGDEYLAKILNKPDDPMRETAAEFTAMLVSHPELEKGYRRLRGEDYSNDSTANCDKLLADYKKAMETGKGEDLKKVSDALLNKKEQQGPVAGL